MKNARAIIDIGSNSVRLKIARIGPSSRIQSVVEDREMVRLGRSIVSTGCVDTSALNDALRTMKRFAGVIRRHRIGTMRVFATAALRDANNGPAVADSIKKTLRAPVRILTGREEGEFLLRGARVRFDLTRGVRIVTDLGGGSLQIMRTVSGFTSENTSIPIGVLRLAERFGGGRFTTASYREMSAFVRDQLACGLLRNQHPCEFLAGAGGAFAACESIARASGLRGPVSRDEVGRQLRLLRPMDPETRGAVPGLDPKRADIIVPALCVVYELMKHVRAASFINYGDGVRDGMLLEAFDGPEDDSVDAVSSATRLLRRAPREVEHSLRVRHLAGMILDQLIALNPHRFGRLACRGGVLEVAALLHDIGVPIDYESHHVWSSRIVRSELIRHLSEPERNAVAVLVLHHRKQDLTVEKAREYGFRGTQARELLVLTSILRAADALDRSHKGRVDRVRIERDADRTLCIRVDAKGDVTRELRSLRKKGSGFLKLVGSNVRVTIR